MSTDGLFQESDSPSPSDLEEYEARKRRPHEVPEVGTGCEYLIDVQRKRACGAEALYYVTVRSELLGAARVPLCLAHKEQHDAKAIENRRRNQH